ncbi:bacteriophage holin [candidate division KSB1 bacterium]
MKLNIKAFALACGLFAGFGLFFITWWMIWFGGAQGEPTIISKVYLGYCVTPWGSFIGLVWAFFDFLIGGAIFAWLYNMLANKFAPAKTE